MATRHQARAAIVSLLYSYDFHQNDDFVQEFLDENKIKNKIREWTLELFYGVINNLEKIDEIIQKALDNESTLANVEHNILRLGVYEIVFTDIDSPIAINEAIELTKDLGVATGFVNGVLDRINKELKLSKNA